MLKVRSQLSEYFVGVRKSFELKIDIEMSTFCKNVRGSKKYHGCTRSYKDIANNIK